MESRLLLGAALLSAIVAAIGMWRYALWARRQRAGLLALPVPQPNRATSLPLIKRVTLESRLTKATIDCLKKDEGVTVFFIGVDGFKRVNREFGHDVGDRVLRNVAHRLRALPDAFDCVAHMGGDEFAAFVQSPTDRLMAQRIAEEAIAAVAQPHDLLGVGITVTCSIGMSCYPQFRPAQKLLAYAHLAMCAAKAKSAGTCAFYTGERDVIADEALELARDLRGAIDRKELHLVFQPKIDAQSGKITATEALLRWTHPERGVVPPTVFIPVAERFGLIDEIGEWVIDEACRNARIWRTQGLRMRIAVNLSARQLTQPNLPHRIRAILRRHRIHPSLLTCEITESLAVESTEANRLALINLEKSGLNLSIDDFGTGYSSLAYLRQLPARELKIDRSFVTDLGESEHAYSIVDAVIRMSHALGKRVVAEGVENRRQMEILVELGCDELQGYYFAKPMSAELLLEWATSPPDGGPRFHPALFGETQSQMLVI